MQSARTDLWKFKQLATYDITKIYERELWPDQIPIPPKISPQTIYRSRYLQTKTQTVYRRETFVRRCKFARTSSSAPSARVSEAAHPPIAFRQKDDSRSTPLANAMEENRRNMKAIDLRSRRILAESKDAARSLTGARRLNCIDIENNVRIYIILLGNRDGLRNVS